MPWEGDKVGKASLIIIDTGYFVALFSKKDRSHKQALSLRSKIDKRSWITTWPVVTEVCHLLQKYAPQAQKPFLTLFHDGIIDVFNLHSVHFTKIVSLFEKYENLPIDLADASLVILAEELSIGDIVSTDKRDFKVYRWNDKNTFRNLMDDC